MSNQFQNPNPSASSGQVFKFQINLDKILRFLIAIFLFLLPWQTIWVYRWGVLNNAKWEYGTLGFYATEILLWIIIILFIVWYYKRIKFQISNFKFQITSDRVFVFICLLFIIYHLSSIFWAQDGSLALQQSLRALEAFLLFFILFLGPLDSKSAIKWFVIGSIIPAILGIWQFLTQSTFAFKWLGLALHPVWEAGTSVIQSDAIGRWLRAYGSFNHPNIFGGYLVIAIILLLFVCHSRESGDLENKKLDSCFRRNDSLKCIFPITVYCLLITVLFFTFSRSAWLALGIGLLICVFTKNPSLPSSTRGGKHWGLSFIILSFIIIALLSILYFSLVQTRFSNQSISELRSTEERVSGYGEAWQIFKQHPWLGVGAGNYTAAAHELNPNHPGWEYQPVHNAIILFATEQGTVGLLLFVFLILSFISYLLSKNQYDIYFVLMFFCFLVLMFFDHYLYSSYIGLMLSAVFFAVFARFNSHHLHS